MGNIHGRIKCHKNTVNQVSILTLQYKSLKEAGYVLGGNIHYD